MSENFKDINTTKSDHFILRKLEGNIDSFNDVIIIKSSQQNAKFNVIFFGGDIQNYEDEMKKSSTCRLFTDWNLLATGYLLERKFSKNSENAANILIFRADYFHLKCFANYSNFVSSTDFGIPIANLNDMSSKLDQNEDNSISSMPMTNKFRCIDHIKKLFFNSLSEYNSVHSDQIEDKLPIILCGFSKGCVVLNQLCTELCSIVEPGFESIREFLGKIKHIFWLDGGHSGTSNSWITTEDIIHYIKNFKWSCYVYITPYQLKSQKIIAVQEYESFIALLKKFDVNIKNIYYFREKESDDYDVNLHFELLKHFDSNLI